MRRRDEEEDDGWEDMPAEQTAPPHSGGQVQLFGYCPNGRIALVLFIAAVF